MFFTRMYKSLCDWIAYCASHVPFMNPIRISDKLKISRCRIYDNFTVTALKISWQSLSESALKSVHYGYTLRFWHDDC